VFSLFLLKVFSNRVDYMPLASLKCFVVEVNEIEYMKLIDLNCEIKISLEERPSW